MRHHRSHEDDDVFTSGPSGAISTREGGRYDFDDGGTYRGKWKDGKAHGHGVCTGPGGQGKFAGVWEDGFEILGFYEWPSGDNYLGDWSKGYRHNLGVEVREGWTYKGEWEAGVKGTLGVLVNKRGVVCYEGKWKDSLKNGLGTETYADGGTYKGEWVAGKRHGYGVRRSATYARASIRRSSNNITSSLDKSEFDIRSDTNSSVSGGGYPGHRSRNGFVLDHCGVLTHMSGSSKSRRKSILSRMKSKSSLGAAYSMLSLKSSKSAYQPSSGKSGKRKSAKAGKSTQFNSFDVGCSMDEDDSAASHDYSHIDDDVTETYYGEWMNNCRHGHGVCQRSDGLTYEGQWANDQRHGYGVTSYSNGQVFEGYYKLNVFVGARRHTILPKGNKDKILMAVVQSNKTKQAAMKIVESVATCVYQCRTVAAQAEQVATNARKHAKTADKVAYEINRKSLKNKKAFTIHEDKPRVANEAEIRPSNHLPTTCQATPRTTPRTAQKSATARQQQQQQSRQAHDKRVNENIIDKIIPDVASPNNSPPKRGAKHHHQAANGAANGATLTVGEEKLKRNFFRPFRSKVPASEMLRVPKQEDRSPAPARRKAEGRRGNHHSRYPAKNEDEDDESFDWRNADAKSKRKQWASQTSAGRRRTPEAVAATRGEASTKPHYSSAREVEDDADVDDMIRTSHISLEIHPLKPRNSKLQPKIHAQTIETAAADDDDDGGEGGGKKKRTRDEFEHRRYVRHVHKPEDYEEPKLYSEEAESEQTGPQSGIPTPVVVASQPKDYYSMPQRQHQFRNIYQMILVFILNVGFVFMILRIPSTSLPEVFRLLFKNLRVLLEQIGSGYVGYRH